MFPSYHQGKGLIFKPISHFKVMTVITTEMRYHLMKESIKYSDAYDENFDLFNRGIHILEERIKNQDFSEFTVDERTTLEQIMECINCKQQYPKQNCKGCNNHKT